MLQVGAKTEYWKTGHSYIKRRVNELGALAGFEKSGHFFYNPPIGRGYDDGLITAIAVCDVLDRNPARRSRTSTARCRRPGARRRWRPLRRRGEITASTKGEAASRAAKAGRESPGRRFATSSPSTACASPQDGTWGLVRASSNKPELVVVVESPVSEARMRDMFKAVDGVLRENPEVGAYNQTI